MTGIGYICCTLLLVMAAHHLRAELCLHNTACAHIHANTLVSVSFARPDPCARKHIVHVLHVRNNDIFVWFTGSSGVQKCTQACGVVLMHTQAMSGMTCGGTKSPMKTDTSARSATHGSPPLARERYHD